MEVWDSVSLYGRIWLNHFWPMWKDIRHQSLLSQLHSQENREAQWELIGTIPRPINLTIKFLCQSSRASLVWPSSLIPPLSQNRWNFCADWLLCSQQEPASVVPDQTDMALYSTSDVIVSFALVCIIPEGKIQVLYYALEPASCLGRQIQVNKPNGCF